MKIIIYFLAIILCSKQIHAQRSNDNKLQDSVFTWGPLQPLMPEKYPRTFTAEQKKLPELFYQWVRKSYTLLGSINTDKSMAIAEPNNKDEVSPYMVGLFAPTYAPAWDNDGKKIVRQPHSENPIRITTNFIIDATQIPLLTAPGRSVFMRRSADIEKTFSKQYYTNLIKSFNLKQHPQIGKYIFQFYGCEGDMCQPNVAVYITPNGRLPIRQLSRGEVLNMAEQAIPAEAEKARKKIKAENSYRMDQQVKWLKNFDDNTLPQWKNNIEKLRNKYNGKLDVPAEIRNPNGVEMINFFNADDIFGTTSSGISYGIFTYEDGILEKSKQDKPLWICISWSPASQDAQFQGRELHRSITSHFNFDYVYDYFYNPQKVKGVAYSTLNPNDQKVAITKSIEKKNAIVPTKNLPAGVILWDDFLQNTINATPNGWYIVNIGAQPKVASLNNQKGNWVELGDHKLIPNTNHFKNAFPDNFIFEFDMVTSNFTTPSGGALELLINNNVLQKNGDFASEQSSKQKRIEFLIHAGNEDLSYKSDGYSYLKVTYGGMPDKLRYGATTQYNNYLSNRKTKAHVKITKQGTAVKAFVNGYELLSLDANKKNVAGYNELPEGSKFTYFQFLNKTKNKENKVYISNVKITAL